MKARLLTAFAVGTFLVLVLTWTVAAQGGWVQVNLSGFGDADNRYVHALAPFGGRLYAGAASASVGVSQLWRLGIGGWTPVMTDGFGNGNNGDIDHLIEFDSQLYAGTYNAVEGGEVWRSSNGDTWNRVVSAGFNDPTNGEIMRFAVFSDTLYASTWSYTETHGAEIWSSGTGDSLDWTRVVSNGFDADADNGVIPSFEVFSDTLYAGTRNLATGGEVWRSSDGTTWSQVNADGFGTANNRAVSALATFGNYLYASIHRLSGTGGVEVWRCQLCDGSDWSQVVNNGFGNALTRLMPALEVFNGHLYLVVGNGTTGLEVWRTVNGTNWEQVGFAGFGDSNNKYSYWDSAVTVFNGGLYVGTRHDADGGKVWLYLHNRVYLPAVLKNY